jgi:hypothetical protein
MAGLFVKIFKQWAETAIVNKLADNRSMQKAAVGAVEAAQMAQRLAESAAKDPSQLTAGLSSLWTALQKEASKDLGTGVVNGGGGGGETVIDVSSPSASRPVPITDSFSKMSSKELKENLIKRGISVSGLFEKSELLAAAREGGGSEGGGASSDKMR